MILSLDELISTVSARTNDQGCPPKQALWVRFSEQQTHTTMEYRTADDKALVHVYLDKNRALVGIEIFS